MKWVCVSGSVLFYLPMSLICVFHWELFQFCFQVRGKRRLFADNCLTRRGVSDTKRYYCPDLNLLSDLKKKKKAGRENSISNQAGAQFSWPPGFSPRKTPSIRRSSLRQTHSLCHQGGGGGRTQPMQQAQKLEGHPKTLLCAKAAGLGRRGAQPRKAHMSSNG